MTKNILLYSHKLDYDGACISLFNICNTLKDIGYNVEVWSNIDGPQRAEYENINVETKIIPYSAIVSLNLTNEIKCFDLCLINTSAGAYAYDILSKYLHCIWYIHEAKTIPLYMNCEMLDIFRRAEDKDIYCVSEYAKNYIKEEFKKDISILLNYIPDRFDNSVNSSHNVINFLCLGVLQDLKNFELPIFAFKNLPCGYKDKVHLYIAGKDLNSGYSKNILNLINDCSNITYLGEITKKEDLNTLQGASNVFIVPSKEESMSLVALEGLMMGKPIIVSTGVGAKYLVNEDNGFIIDPFDIRSLINIVKLFVDKPNLLTELGINSRDRYIKYLSYTNFKNNLINVIDKHTC